MTHHAIVLAGCMLMATVTATEARYGQANAEDIRTVTAAEAERLAGTQQALIVDVRGTEAYLEGHVAGAISIPLSFLGPRSDELVKDDRLIVLYCACVADASSLKAAVELSRAGSRHVAVIRGGWSAWNSARLPVRSGSTP